VTVCVTVTVVPPPSTVVEAKGCSCEPLEPVVAEDGEVRPPPGGEDSGVLNKGVWPEGLDPLGASREEPDPSERPPDLP
jgi:hypothetical protein